MPTVNSYAIDATVRLSVAFDDGATPPVAADPTTVTLRVKDPAGVTVTYTGGQLTNPAVGSYLRDVSLDQEGWWTYRWEGAGAVEVAVERKMYVRLSSIV
jgi:hypothetical protein